MSIKYHTGSGVLLKPTVRAVNAVRKKYNLSKKASLSAEQYREAVGISSAKSSDRTFAFRFKLLHFTYKGIVLEVEGNHLSKNRVDSLPLKHRIRYKNAFKDGARALYLLERKRLRSFTTMQKAKVHFVFYTTHDRDYDNHSETIKRIQDTAVSILGILPDDNPDIITPQKPKYYKVKNKNDRRVLMVIRRILH